MILTDLLNMVYTETPTDPPTETEPEPEATPEEKKVITYKGKPIEVDPQIYTYITEDLRAENAKTRKERDALIAKSKEQDAKIEEIQKSIEREKLTEQEKAKAEADEAKLKLAEMQAILAAKDKETELERKRRMIASTASRHNFYDPEDAVMAIRDAELESLDTSDIDAMDALILSLAIKKPHLVKPEKQETPSPVVPPLGATNASGSYPKPKLTDGERIAEMKKQFMELSKQGKMSDATRISKEIYRLEHSPMGRSYTPPGEGG